MALPEHLNTREYQKFVEVGSQVAVNTKSLTGMVTESYDYIAVTYPTSSSEQYVFKTGGSGGTTVATVVVTYTSSAKTDLSSVEKT